MSTLREQFEAQCKQAAFTSAFYSIDLDIVMVRHKGYATRISILGNAINRAAYHVWRADGSQVRLLCIYNAEGKQVKPKKEIYALL